METKLIYNKLLNIMKESGSVAKARKNQSQGYSFRGIDDVMNELHEKFAQNGVFILTDIVNQKREERATKSGGINIYSINTYRFTFMAEDGSFVQSTQIGEAMDSGDKASNKATSVALKYTLLFMFMIPTDDPKDPENESPELGQVKNQKTAPLPNNPKQQASNFENGKKEANGKKPDAPVLLRPDLPVWGKLISYIEKKGVTELDWKELKKNYIVTEADEKLLFEATGMLPF